MKACMDELKFVIGWQGGAALGAETAVKVTGIQLEGATFDGQSLRDCVHSSPTICAVPAADIAWILQVFYRNLGFCLETVKILKTAKDPYNAEETVSMPLYTNEFRERVVITMKLPCGRDKDKWIISGAALYLKT